MKSSHAAAVGSGGKASPGQERRGAASWVGVQIDDWDVGSTTRAQSASTNAGWQLGGSSLLAAAKGQRAATGTWYSASGDHNICRQGGKATGACSARAGMEG
uniref:Uncharacterized protein n=1 Tax=Setaria viridis TaxID=4556 RepID=A0A4U6W1V2_SETVI|nr:hypothetical protein SEVIR_2G431050v2 [Setaria viridis]